MNIFKSIKGFYERCTAEDRTQMLRPPCPKLRPPLAMLTTWSKPRLQKRDGLWIVMNPEILMRTHHTGPYWMAIEWACVMNGSRAAGVHPCKYMEGAMLRNIRYRRDRKNYDLYIAMCCRHKWPPHEQLREFDKGE